MTTETKQNTPVTTTAKTVTSIGPATAVSTFTAEQKLELQSLIVGAAAQIVGGLNAAQAGQPAARAPASQQVLEECIVCKQVKSACEGKHKTMVVYPTRYPEFVTFFHGVKINGTIYCSPDFNTPIEIPACAESMIINTINEFENNEKTIKLGRSKMHNSGSIGKGSTGPVNAVSAWR